ncbi:response regulator [Sphingomonas crusticola]|uniref:response regulator n=1 Tax=Sphingomonas crusticola TaxID=1697973 RepID=UPI000E254B6D|nr:response regulator [Sphingomonas crusticola]
MTDTLRVLIVEDEMTIALLLEEMVEDLGHQVAGLAMRLPQAIELAHSRPLDLAILDVNLDGHMSYPVAEVLAERGVPYVFATGYGSAGIDAQYRDRVIIKKPYALDDIKGAIENALAP